MLTFPRKILVVEPDPKSALAIANLALESLPPHAEAIVAKAANSEGAKRLIEELAVTPGSSHIIVICASDLEGAGSGLHVLAYARKHHPDMRAIVLTNGEIHELAQALEQGVDGIHGRRAGIDGLRSILTFLASEDRHVPVPALQDPLPAASAAQEAERAFEDALERVESARDALRRAGRLLSGAAQAKVQDAERHALESHRRLLEAQRAMRSDARD